MTNKRSSKMGTYTVVLALIVLAAIIVVNMIVNALPTKYTVIDTSAEKLGMGLSVIIDILNPERIVLGGIYTRCEELFSKKMREVLERETLFASLSVCEILPAILGESIGDVAALAVADSI
jgi:glucokinase